jgi:hypothetical protein
MRIENSGEDKQGKVGNKERNSCKRVGPGVKKGLTGELIGGLII